MMMQSHNWVNGVVELLSFAMLFMGLMISFAQTVHKMIPLYRIQCLSLIVVTLLTAYEAGPIKGEPTWTMLLIGSFITVPILLFLFIEPLLAQATVPENLLVRERLRRLLIWRKHSQVRKQAIPVWLLCGKSSEHMVRTVLIDLLLIALAFVTAFYLFGGNPMTAASGAQNDSVMLRFKASILAVSLSLLLLGISAMSRKEDTISQVIGLLVMEQGMFLAALRLIDNPTIQVTFVIGLLLYTFTTLIILVTLMPELHRLSGSIEVDHQNLLKG